MKKIISAYLVFLFCFNFAVCVRADSPKVFKIGITEFEPMNYYDNNGELIGFDTELAKYISEKLGMIPEFVHINWDLKEIELNSGNIDCIWNALTFTDDRSTRMDLSYPYAKGSYIVITKKSNIDKFKSLDEMSGLKFAVEEYYVSEMLTYNYNEYICVNSDIEALQAVQTGKADACVLYSLSANKLLKNSSFSDLEIVYTLTEEKFVIALEKDSLYTKKINDILSLAKDEGILYELASKYSVDVCWDDIPNINYNEFKDVSSQYWAYDYICKMSKNGIITGYGNGLFGPEDNITRAQFATMLCRFANIDTTNIFNTTFSDVSMTDWYATYVESAKPYFKGYSNNSYFNPDTYAKREDIAEALVKLKCYDTSLYNEEEFKTIFTDWNEINPDARKYVFAAAKNNLINGYSDKTFRGEANITRAEAATLFYKLSA